MTRGVVDEGNDGLSGGGGRGNDGDISSRSNSASGRSSSNLKGGSGIAGRIDGGGKADESNGVNGAVSDLALLAAKGAFDADVGAGGTEAESVGHVVDALFEAIAVDVRVGALNTKAAVAPLHLLRVDVAVAVLVVTSLVLRVVLRAGDGGNSGGRSSYGDGSGNGSGSNVGLRYHWSGNGSWSDVGLGYHWSGNTNGSNMSNSARKRKSSPANEGSSSDGSANAVAHTGGTIEDGVEVGSNDTTARKATDQTTTGKKSKLGLGRSQSRQSGEDNL